MKWRTLLTVSAGLVAAMPLISHAEVRELPPPEVRRAASVSVFFGGPGSGFVRTPNLEVDCSSDCTRAVLHPGGGMITLTAIPRSLSTFAGWGGPLCSGTSPTCDVPFSAGVHRVIAYFRSSFKRVAVGAYHTCALRPAGDAVCWGLNTDGQLGAGVVTRSEPPIPVIGGINAVAIAAGGYHTCALAVGGTVLCWGNNKEGEIGIARNDRNVPNPTVVPGITEAVAITAGAFHTCVVLAGGSAMCWGQNLNGQLGNNSTTPTNAPVAVALGAVGPLANQITAGGFHTCAIVKDSTVACWGMNNDGQLGIGTKSSAELTPGKKVQTDASGCPPSCFKGTKIAASLGVGQIAGSALGGFFTVAVDTNGMDWGWGDGSNYQIGINYQSYTQPVAGEWFKGGGSPYSPAAQPCCIGHIAAGAYHTCISSAVDGVFCRGNNNNYQVDGSPFNPTNDAVTLPSGTVFDVGAGGYHSCAVIWGAVQSVACWGEDRDGQVTGNAGGGNVGQPVVLTVP